MNGILDGAQIEQLLHAEWKGRIGCSRRGLTYVVPTSYAYDGTSIFGVTGKGLKVEVMRENPQVCFEIDRSPDLASWESVIVHGTYEELRDEAADAATALLRARLDALGVGGLTPPYGAGRDRVGDEDAGPRVEIVYRIVVSERTGRFGRPGPLG